MEIFIDLILGEVENDFNIKVDLIKKIKQMRTEYEKLYDNSPSDICPPPPPPPINYRN